MTEALALTVATVSLGVSLVTAWLALLRRGTVKMTQPTVIFFGPDSPGRERRASAKIYLRTLLFSTSKRGHVIESMHVRLSGNEAHQNFNIWVYGERARLVRGSGLFVGEAGVAADHHFLPPPDRSGFVFSEGRYRLEVFAHLLGDHRSIQLFTQDLTVSRETAEALAEPDTGVYFDWGPDAARYYPHVEKRAPSPDLEALLRDADA